jgi:alkanesulfonate monooxygenase SsuD/methylene tetrahydromethanopterin reductase-like flavin-dependent oxidoreductase (luciferase family)
MQIAIVAIPSAPQGGEPAAMLARVVDFGQRVERLGFAGCWIVDAFARGQAMLDPLMFLSTLAGVTERIELGTCVMQVPLRHPVELAHRAQTLNVLSGARFRFGVGSGSTRHDFDAVQADYERRFKTLPESLSVMRRVWAGEAVHGPALSLRAPRAARRSSSAPGAASAGSTLRPRIARVGSRRPSTPASTTCRSG